MELCCCHTRCAVGSNQELLGMLSVPHAIEGYIAGWFFDRTIDRVNAVAIPIIACRALQCAYFDSIPAIRKSNNIAGICSRQTRALDGTLNLAARSQESAMSKIHHRTIRVLQPAYQTAIVHADVVD